MPQPNARLLEKWATSPIPLAENPPIMGAEWAQSTPKMDAKPVWAQDAAANLVTVRNGVLRWSAPCATVVHGEAHRAQRWFTVRRTVRNGAERCGAPCATVVYGEALVLTIPKGTRKLPKGVGKK
jgi:hypothetical protein